MPVQIDDAWSYHGLKVIRLENEILALDVLPERGGNIFRLIDKPRDLDLLWKSPRVRPHLYPKTSRLPASASGAILLTCSKRAFS